MRKLRQVLMFVAVLLTVEQTAYSQTVPTSTTLSAAMADDRTTRMTVASATGFVASTGTLDYGVFVEHEFMRITAVSGTTITVQRGQSRTNATPHPSGARVWVGRYGSSATGDTAGGPFIQSPLYGSCTASGVAFLPLIQVNANAIGGQAMYNCNRGFWVKQTLLNDADSATPTRVCTPPGLQTLALLTTFGDTTAPFVVGTNTTPVAGRVYYGTVYLPETRLLTGVSLLNGTVGGTDNINLAIYRADGVGPLAKTLAGGTLASGIGRFQDIAFTAVYLATGPARYWIAAQINGTTTRFRTINLTPGATTAGLGAFIGVLGSFLPSTTFDVLPSDLTTGAAGASTAATALPTSLIDASVPITCLY